MALRDRCGDRCGSLYGLSDLDMVGAVRVRSHDSGVLQCQIMDTVDSVFFHFPIAHDMLEARFQEKYWAQDRTYQCGFVDRYAGCRDRTD